MSDNDESDINCDGHAKTAAIFAEFLGGRAGRLEGARYNHDSAAAIAKALGESGEGNPSVRERAACEIAFHLTDWAADAAFIVAVQLFPERFTPEEIADGVEAFLIHAPNHVAAAAELSCHPIGDIFEIGFRKPEDREPPLPEA